MTHQQSIKSKRPWYANKMTDAVVLKPSYPFRQRASSKDFLSASNLEITSEEVINTSLTINKVQWNYYISLESELILQLVYSIVSWKNLTQVIISEIENKRKGKFNCELKVKTSKLPNARENKRNDSTCVSFTFDWSREQCKNFRSLKSVVKWDQSNRELLPTLISK